MAEGNWQKLWLPSAVAGSLAIAILARRLAPVLLLWAPLPFYMLSIAYGGVPIFIPVWWPFSYYNVRYGVQLLPAFAVFSVLAGYVVGAFARNTTAKIGISVTALLVVAGSYNSIWRAQPVCFHRSSEN